MKIEKLIKIPVLIVLCIAAVFLFELDGQGQEEAAGGVGGIIRTPPTHVRPAPPIDGLESFASGASGTASLFSITDPRPMGLVAELLRRKFGIPISYEEPPWLSPNETIRAHNLPQNRDLAAQYPDWIGPFVPRGGTVLITIPVHEPGEELVAAANVIQATIDNHIGRGNQGGFRLLRLPDGQLSIVGDVSEDEAGRRTARIAPPRFGHFVPRGRSYSIRDAFRFR